MEKIFWVAKDEEGLSPLAFLANAYGPTANYVQPDIDKFLKKNPDCTVVKVKLVEV
jgi:hypothetical protein